MPGVWQYKVGKKNSTFRNNPADKPPTFAASPSHVPAGYDKVGAATDSLKHLSQHLRWVLEVGIHHRYQFATGMFKAVNYSRSKPAFITPDDNPYRVFTGQLLN